MSLTNFEEKDEQNEAFDEEEGTRNLKSKMSRIVEGSDEKKKG